MESSTTARLRVRDQRWRPVKPPDDARRRALARLYARRRAVNGLISALERYELEQRRVNAMRAASSTAVETSS
jgi:hypothetical protein